VWRNDSDVFGYQLESSQQNEKADDNEESNEEKMFTNLIFTLFAFKANTLMTNLVYTTIVLGITALGKQGLFIKIR
jgi:hypothetical protein